MQRIRFTFHQRAALVRAVVLVTMLAGGAATLPAEEQPETFRLRYRFTPGTSIYYSAENRSKIEVQKDEAEQHVQHEEISGKHYRVVSTDNDGNGVLELMIDQAQMSVAVDGGLPVTYDSTKDEEPPASFIGVAQTIGQPLARIKMSPAGEVLYLNWLVPGQRQEADAGTLDILMRLPDGPVALDAIWKEKFESEVTVGKNLQKDVTIMRTYRLVSVEDGRAKIELKTSIITPIHDPALEAQLIQKSPQGTIEFDCDQGILISKETDLDREVVGFNGGKSRIRNITTKSERFEKVERRAAGSDAISTAQEPSPPKQ